MAEHDTLRYQRLVPGQVKMNIRPFRQRDQQALILYWKDVLK